MKRDKNPKRQKSIVKNPQCQKIHTDITLWIFQFTMDFFLESIKNRWIVVIDVVIFVDRGKVNVLLVDVDCLVIVDIKFLLKTGSLISLIARPNAFFGSSLSDMRQ